MAIEARRAKRMISEKRIGKEEVMELIHAMRLAPSCFNNQPWHVVVVDDNESLMNLKKCLSKGNAWASRSPLIFIVASKVEDDCRLSDRRDYHLFSCGLAVGQMILRATELGIIAHPIAGYDPIEIKRLFKIPEDYIIITLVICGYPSDDPSLLSEKQLEAEKSRPERKPVEENFFSNSWGTPLSMRS